MSDMQSLGFLKIFLPKQCPQVGPSIAHNIVHAPDMSFHACMAVCVLLHHSIVDPSHNPGPSN